MKTRAIATLGASALVLATTLVGNAIVTSGFAFAGAPDAGVLAKQAADDASRARHLLAKGKAAAAVRFAEAAVQGAPQDQSYRALLGQIYLQSGRFQSARDAFADALSLSPNDGRSALGLALAQVGAGDWAGARQTLDAHAEVIPIADRGLAVALAGDPGTAVDLLLPAARAPEATAKVRQNLALALALAGRWQESRAVAAIDVAANELDKRMQAWAAFARPVGAADQVASLLGVAPVEDKGQPVALALNAPVAVKPVEVAVVAPVEQAAPAPVAEAVAVAAPAEAPRPSIVFTERKEEAQPLPGSVALAPTPHAKPAVVAQAKPTKPTKVIAVAATIAPTPRAKGAFYVQLGAYENAAVARDGWARAVRRFGGLAGQTPSGMAFKSGAASFYRLSVGGFARVDAMNLCLQYRAKGGACFVREGAGDKVASWGGGAKQVAAR